MNWHLPHFLYPITHRKQACEITPVRFEKVCKKEFPTMHRFYSPEQRNFILYMFEGKYVFF